MQPSYYCNGGPDRGKKSVAKKMPLPQPLHLNGQAENYQRQKTVFRRELFWHHRSFPVRTIPAKNGEKLKTTWLDNWISAATIVRSSPRNPLMKTEPYFSAPLWESDSRDAHFLSLWSDFFRCWRGWKRRCLLCKPTDLLTNPCSKSELPASIYKCLAWNFK